MRIVVGNKSNYVLETDTGELKKGGDDVDKVGVILKIGRKECVEYLDLKKRDWVLQIGKKKFYYSDPSVKFRYAESCLTSTFSILVNEKTQYKLKRIRPFWDIISPFFDGTYDHIDKLDFNPLYALFDSFVTNKEDLMKASEKEREERIKIAIGKNKINLE